MANRRNPSRKNKQRRPHLSEQWWGKNQDILQYLYEELPIQEIAQLVGQSEDQIRAVQEQLEELRKVELNSADTMLILKYLPHPKAEYPPDILEEFEHFLNKLEEEPEDESKPTIRDGSSNHDKYLYG